MESSFIIEYIDTCSPNKLSMLEFKYVKMYDLFGRIRPEKINALLAVLCDLRYALKISCVIYYPETIMHWVRYESIIN